MKLQIVTCLLLAALLPFGSAYGQAAAGIVVQESMRVKGIMSDSQISALTPTQKQTVKIYADGMGRGIQTVIERASPMQNDMVQSMVYDNLGRQTISYLPYADTSTTTTNTGNFRSDALTRQRGFYNNTAQHLVATDTGAYAQQVFENSPLQRMLKSGMAGGGFQPVSGQHFKTVSYRFNTSADGNISIWTLNGTHSAGNNYAVNTLAVTDGVDEDGHENLIFTSMAGQTILKRQMLGTTRMDTYYLYNYAGQISYVLPPGVISHLSPNNFNLNVAIVKNMIFQFSYDSRGRLISKRVPVKGPMTIVYDPLNRPVLMQDSGMTVNNQWNYIKYDVKGRAISQGLYTDATHKGRAAMQAHVDSLNFSVYYEYRSTGAATGYYTNNTFPNTGITPLAYAYFDNYALTGSANFAYARQGLPNEDSVSYYPLKGLPTVTRVNTIANNAATGNWLVKATFYDNRLNVIQVQSNNQLNSGETITDYTTSVPSFIGLPQIVKVSQKNGASATNVRTTFTYDSMSRLKTITQGYNGAGAVPVAAYTYNEFGQMVMKTLGNSIQNVNMRYNIRGQLLYINNSRLVNDGGITSNDSNDLFGMQMLYNTQDAKLLNIPYYNGKLSAIKWMSTDASGNKSAERSTRYSYDGADRYTAGTYAERTGLDTTAMFALHKDAYDERGIVYDLNGNITGLSRTALNTATGANTLIDSLNYTYMGNSPDKLVSITDAGNNQGFNNITGSTTGSYTYDGNGNLTADPYKGIMLKYNFMNKTDSIKISAGNYVTYTYDANGTMIRKKAVSASTATTTDYVNGFTYITTTGTATLSYYPMPEGRVLAATTTQQYIISDQQGNARLMFQANSSGVATVVQENSYYGYGLIMPNSPVSTPSPANKKLYNGGSEWQNDEANNLPDYYNTLNRNYDAATARFVAVDPVAESAESMTPFGYAGGNPIGNNDPDGDLYKNPPQPLQFPNSHDGAGEFQEGIYEQNAIDQLYADAWDLTYGLGAELSIDITSQYVGNGPVLGTYDAGAAGSGSYGLSRNGEISPLGGSATDVNGALINVLFAENTDGTIQPGNFEIVDQGILEHNESNKYDEPQVNDITGIITYNSVNINYYEFNYSSSTISLFEFVARNSNVEWSLFTYLEGSQKKAFLGTDDGPNNTTQSDAFSFEIDRILHNPNETILDAGHDHPAGQQIHGPSGYFPWDTVKVGDIQVAQAVYGHLPDVHINYWVFDVDAGYFNYRNNSKYSPEANNPYAILGPYKNYSLMPNP